MSHLISIPHLDALRANRQTVVLDCRFDLADPSAGQQAYSEGHIPGAHYVPLNDALSGPVDPLRGGRHPLPDPERAAGLFAALGITSGETEVVAYDTVSGPYAARCWWLLRWLGHERVRVLDGGWTAWLAAGEPVRTGPEPLPRPGRFTPAPVESMLVTREEIRAGRCGLLVDARAPERFRGEHETIDRVAGHIPGALNRPWQEALQPDGRLEAPADTRRRMAGLGKDPVMYCGSGVTACVNILAMEEAGYPPPRLYAGSWSDWICDPDARVATGATSPRR